MPVRTNASVKHKAQALELLLQTFPAEVVHHPNASFDHCVNRTPIIDFFQIEVKGGGVKSGSTQHDLSANFCIRRSVSIANLVVLLVKCSLLSNFCHLFRISGAVAGIASSRKTRCLKKVITAHISRIQNCTHSSIPTEQQSKQHRLQTRRMKCLVMLTCYTYQRTELLLWMQLPVTARGGRENAAFGQSSQ